jgi:hypothetical protein
LHDVADDLRALQRQRLSLNAIARRLNDEGIRTTSGHGQWTATAVRRRQGRTGRTVEISEPCRTPAGRGCPFGGRSAAETGRRRPGPPSGSQFRKRSERPMWQNPHSAADSYRLRRTMRGRLRSLRAGTGERHARRRRCKDAQMGRRLPRPVAGERPQHQPSVQLEMVKPEQRIFSQGDEARDVFFIVQGAVRITSYSMMGKQVSFRDLAVGQSFGDLAAIDGRPRRQRPWQSPIPCWRHCRRARTGRR